MRILMLAFAFPPYNKIGAVRSGKMAKYLTRMGHEVRVIASSDVSTDTSLPLEIAPEWVAYARWRQLSPRAKLQQVSDTGASAATGTRQASHRSLRSRTRAICRVALDSLIVPDAMAGWVRPAVQAATALAPAWSPEVIYATALPASTLLAARQAHRHLRVPWVAEFRDLWAGNPYSRAPAWRRALDRWLEMRVLTSATGIVTVADGSTQALQARYGKPTVTIPNGFDPEDFPQPDDTSSRPGLTIAYTGQLYGERRDPTPLFQAIKLLGADGRDVSVDFYVVGDDRSVRASAEASGLTAQVRIHGKVPYAASLSAQVHADLLLLLLWNDPRERSVLTGKLFEYLGARRPILALGRPDNAAAQLITERGAGLASTDATEIAGYLHTMLEVKRRQGGIAALPTAVGAGLTRMDQARALADFLEQLVTSRTCDGDAVGERRCDL